jgi:altronate hydrolase
VLNIQDEGGITRTVEAAVRAVFELLPEANACQRTEQPASKIHLALECGGSDGNSGVTANPALGVAADLVVAQGGTAVLGETTEIYGAEHLLTRRAVSRAVGEKLIERIKWWEWYTGIFGAEINNNPSPGNKDGGLTTIYEKSLGAIAKGGSTALVDVVGYAEPVKAKGFVVMDTPGYDPVSMTGIVAGGANVLVFTTGRGSVFGCKPAPSIKVATNTPMYNHMIDDMDVNAGVVLDGTPVAEVGQRIFEEILAVAGGKKTKSEINGVGEEEFAPWSIGPTL